MDYEKKYLKYKKKYLNLKGGGEIKKVGIDKVYINYQSLGGSFGNAAKAKKNEDAIKVFFEETKHDQRKAIEQNIKYSIEDIKEAITSFSEVEREREEVFKKAVQILKEKEIEAQAQAEESREAILAEAIKNVEQAEIPIKKKMLLDFFYNDLNVEYLQKKVKILESESFKVIMNVFDIEKPVIKGEIEDYIENKDYLKNTYSEKFDNMIKNQAKDRGRLIGKEVVMEIELINSIDKLYFRLHFFDSQYSKDKSGSYIGTIELNNEKYEDKVYIKKFAYFTKFSNHIDTIGTYFFAITTKKSNKHLILHFNDSPVSHPEKDFAILLNKIQEQESSTMFFSEQKNWKLYKKEHALGELLLNNESEIEFYDLSQSRHIKLQVKEIWYKFHYETVEQYIMIYTEKMGQERLNLGLRQKELEL